MSEESEVRVSRLPCPVPREKLDKIRRQKSEYLSASLVAQHPVEKAVAVVDNLDPLTAAIIFITFVLQSECDEPRCCNCSREYAQSFVAEARKQKIQGSLGLCYARDQVYNKMGYFTVG